MKRRAALVLIPLLSGLFALPASSGAVSVSPPAVPGDDTLQGESAPPQPVTRDRLGNLPPPDASTPESGSRAWFREIEARRAERLMRMEQMGRIDNCPHDFDVLHYALDLNIDFAVSQIRGSTRVRSTSEVDGLQQITLDLAVLTVDSVRAGSGPLSFVRHNPFLTIELGQSYAVGDTFEVEVFYHGTPGNEGPGGFGGFWFSTANGGTAFQMGVGLVADPPSMGKYWFPCWDWPCDKATAEFRITVPDGKKAVCNGALVREDRNEKTRSLTFTWSETHQIAPHLMMVAASNYTEMVDATYDWIHYWVYPNLPPFAATHFENVHTMMDAFVSRYGPYPFDKFGYAAAPKGDMEHQTCVTHISSVIVASHTYDWLLAHEMSHQWWGDCVAINDWRDIWLSEGFATYSEAIHREYAYGLANYLAYIQSSLMQPVFSSSENFPIYDPDYMWGTTVYEKGGTVLHMLRHVVGDEAFFEALALYRSLYEHGNAVTTQFQAAVEAVHGQSLDWFFQEWIHGVGWPVYRFAWVGQTTPGPRLLLAIDQIQTNGPIFTMPLDVKVATAAGDTLLVLWVNDAHEFFDIPLHAAPTAVTLDPDNWILNQAQQVAAAAVGDLMTDGGTVPALHVQPNPFATEVGIRYALPRDGDVRAEVFNPAGARVRLLADGPHAAGEVELIWDGRDDAGRALPSGIYFLRLTGSDTGDADQSMTRRIVLLR
jgi:aminopeptidase N